MEISVFWSINQAGLALLAVRDKTKIFLIIIAVVTSKSIQIKSHITNTTDTPLMFWKSRNAILKFYTILSQ